MPGIAAGTEEEFSAPSHLHEPLADMRRQDRPAGQTNIQHRDPPTGPDTPTTDRAVRKGETKPVHCPATQTPAQKPTTPLTPTMRTTLAPTHQPHTEDTPTGLTNIQCSDPHIQPDPLTTDRAVRKGGTTPLHCPAT